MTTRWLTMASLLLLGAAGCGKVNNKCRAGQAACGSACIDITSDSANCGKCGNACATGQTCAASACTCASPLLACGAACVDPQTDSNHCGTCDTVCAGGKTCQTGSCACPTGQTDCSGTCADFMTNSSHCGMCGNACPGTTCSAGACTNIPIPDGGVSDMAVNPPAPVILTKWITPTGTVDAVGNKPTMTFAATGIPGTIYECRTGAAASFTPTVPAWANCDAGDGSNPTHTPSLPTDIDGGGSFRTEYRYRIPSAAFTSTVLSYNYYVHNSLNFVPTCPTPIYQPSPLPMAQYFAFAKTFDATNFPTTATFPNDGTVQLTNPFISIPFAGVATTVSARAHTILSDGFGGSIPIASLTSYTTKTLSLHHEYLLSADRTMIAMHRIYLGLGPVLAGTCETVVKLGDRTGWEQGPPDVRLGASVGAPPGIKITSQPWTRWTFCDAYLVNTQGRGLCLAQRDPVSHVPTPGVIHALKIDAHLSFKGAGGSTLAGTTNTASSFNTFVVNGTNFGATNMAGKWVRFGGVAPWYKINSSNNTVIGLTTPLADNVAANTTITIHSGPLVDTFVAPNGYQHIRGNDPANVGVGKLQVGNKCSSSAACDDGKEGKLFYMPP